MEYKNRRQQRPRAKLIYEPGEKAQFIRRFMKFRI